MINSREDYLFYLEKDRKALGLKKNNIRRSINEIFLPNHIWRFQRMLRRLEYVKNCRKGIFSVIYYCFLKYRFLRLSIWLGFTIPENVFGPGLAIVHYGTIVVNANAKVGKNCRLHPSTCIGSSAGKDAAPKIGDNVYIGPGAKIYGDIVIPNNVAIAANSAVARSFDEENILVGGIPAQKIKSINIRKIIKCIE